MSLLPIFTISLALSVYAEDRTAPENMAAKTPGSGWECDHPIAKTCRDDSGRASCVSKVTDEMAKDYMAEMQCMALWLSKSSTENPKGLKVDAALYEKQRTRALFLIEQISDWTRTVSFMGQKPATEADRRQSRKLWQSGLIHFQRSDYVAACKDWHEASRLDAANDDARMAMERDCPAGTGEQKVSEK